MDKGCLTKLTNELYLLTRLFPKKEPLRYKMRGVADDILADFIKFLNKNPLKTENNHLDILSNLEILDAFFEVAKEQNWVSQAPLAELQKEYDKIRESLAELKTQNLSLFSGKKEMAPDGRAGQIKSQAEARISNALVRQQKIIEILKEKEKAQTQEFKKIFPEVTKRTLRRDLDQLLKQGSVERIGERNLTFYKIRS